jgi:simple sugar transport system ATP-binding protein
MAAALHLEGIAKSFDGAPALDQAWFKAEAGQLHALLGENGAGKTSLMNVACGLYMPDRGRILIDGREVVVEGPAHAKSLGIGMVHQHFKLVRPFTVAENVMLANPRPRWRRGLKEITSEIERHGRALGFDIDPRARVDSISVAEQQRVEIVKGLIGGARILILDEPTAVLTDEEADRLLATARTLARQGVAVVLITHKLREVRDYADWVTVMRGGRTLASADPRELSIADLTRLMVGSAVHDSTEPAKAAGPVRLLVEALHASRADGAQTLSGATLAVRAGQIYGVAGVGGNGQTELAETLMGVRPALAGRIVIDEADVTHRHPRARRSRGLVSVPADRLGYGLAADLSVAENLTIAGLQSGTFGSSAWVRGGAMRRETQRVIGLFDIQGAHPATRAGLLSGGNAQKLVLARELDGTAGVILAHSPTRGLDVRACAAVHEHLRRARDAGAAVLLLSEDLDEVLNLSDRIGVINRGRIVGEFDRPADRQAVGALMVGHA